MDSIKYRIWDRVNRKYAEDISLFSLRHDGKIFYGNADYTAMAICEFYIDQQDRNGKYIYEGDVVELWGAYQQYFEVAYMDKEGWGLCDNNVEMPGCIMECNQLWKDCKIVGNRHEHPEFYKMYLI